jgi:HK97 family phage prohead protease/HK97 family phage major capsid protein
MYDKSIPLTIKSADDGTGEFTGYASVFDNIDSHGDIVRRGAFAKSIASDTPVPLLWEHGAADPRNYVGDVVKAAETANGLEITGKFDLNSEFGKAAYRNVKGRRVQGLSIGYRVGKSVKTAAGNELLDLDLIEVSIVARGANARALVGSVKSAGIPTSPIRSRLARAAAERYITDQKVETNTMSQTRIDTFTEKRDSALALVKSLLNTADNEGRDLTADEAERIETATKSAASFDAGIATAHNDMAVMAAAKSFADSVGGPGPSQPATSGRMALTGIHAKRLAASMIKSLPQDANGIKSLAAGQQTTSIVMIDEVQTLGRPAVSLLDVLPSRIVAPSYLSLRQTVRDFFDGTPTAAGALKPTSELGVVSIEGRLRTVAHISDPLGNYELSDSAVLEQFVLDELLYGLRRGLEAQIVAGDGTGENMTGILETSGIVEQAFVTDALTSIRKGLTTLDVSGYNAGVIVVSAQLWESAELLLLSAAATSAQGIPVDAVSRRLFGVPVVISQGLGADTALVLGDSAVTVDTDGQIVTRSSDAVSDDFARNRRRILCETRANVSINQPGAIIKVITAD